MLRQALGRLEPLLARAYHRLLEPPPPNLKGDRHIEYSWIAAHIPEGQGGRALDFGTGPGWSWMGLLAARKGFDAIANDIQDAVWPYVHPKFAFQRGDILKLNFPDEYFDLIINCSSVEHVGLEGRYEGTLPAADGDLEAMQVLLKALKRGCPMLLTIPVGRDRLFAPLHRVYGRERLPRLLSGYAVERAEYWIKDDKNRWVCVPEEAALGREAIERCYGLGLFVLRRPL